MVHDVNLMDALVYEPGAFYIFDRGYIDFLRLKRIDTEKAFFVIRQNDHCALQVSNHCMSTKLSVSGLIKRSS